MANHATVKSVISGDTLVLVGKATSGPPKEITVTLASLSCPRISRGPQQLIEDPFAFESREFLRKLTVGKAVTFRIIYCVTQIEKYYADVDLVDPTTGESVSIAKLVVSNGWGAVKETRDEKISAIHDELFEAYNTAKQAKVGMFTTDSKLKAIATRKPKWSPTANEVKAIFDKYENKPVKVIIEYVRDGASFKVYVIEAQTYVSFSLAGVVAPRINATSKANQDNAAVEEGDEETNKANPSSSTPEVYGLQSRHFTELRMLSREVDIVMESLDAKTGGILGTILHPKGNIAVELVRQGLARISERSIASIPKDAALALLHAEHEAKATKRFIWEDLADITKANNTESKVITGICVEVLSGDTIIISPILPTQHVSNIQEVYELATKGVEVRICLSSIRAPKLSLNKGKQETEPWGLESREYLRARLVGKRVQVTVDYEKYLQGGAGGKNNVK